MNLSEISQQLIAAVPGAVITQFLPELEEVLNIAPVIVCTRLVAARKVAGTWRSFAKASILAGDTDLAWQLAGRTIYLISRARQAEVSGVEVMSPAISPVLHLTVNFDFRAAVDQSGQLLFHQLTTL